MKLSTDVGAIIVGAFPTAFTLFCLAAFLVPIWTCVHLSNDPNVKYWMGGRFLAATAWLPVLYIASHVVHTMKGGPVKSAIMACVCGSCVILALAAQLALRDADRLIADFSAEECSSSAGKTALQWQWREAQTFFDNCASTWAAQHAVSVEEAKRQVRITECAGYTEEATKAARRGSWDYLQGLEERYHCSGWCEEAPSMWSSGLTQDACSPAVALVLRSNVRWTAVQVVLYSAVVFVLSSVSLMSVLPVLKRSAAGSASSRQA